MECQSLKSVTIADKAFEKCESLEIACLCVGECVKCSESGIGENSDWTGLLL